MAQDASVKIIRKINEAKKELSGKNVPGCLLHFRTALEIATQDNILPSDKKAVTEAIEKLQSDIQGSQTFKDIYGPVTFSGSEFDVALEFVKQLIQASSEELFESTTLAEDIKAAEEAKGANNEVPMTEAESADPFAVAMACLASGDVEGARQVIGQDEEILDNVVEALNEKGIGERSTGNYDAAIAYYSTGLELCPDEEGLRYNLARAYFEKGDTDRALAYLDEALQLNPEFLPGKELQDFIKRRGAP